MGSYLIQSVMGYQFKMFGSTTIWFILSKSLTLANNAEEEVYNHSLTCDKNVESLLPCLHPEKLGSGQKPEILMTNDKNKERHSLSKQIIHNL